MNKKLTPVQIVLAQLRAEAEAEAKAASEAPKEIPKEPDASQSNRPYWQGRYWNYTTLAAKYGLNVGTLRGRLKRGYTLEDALLTPVQYQSPPNPNKPKRPKHRIVEWQGKQWLVKDLVAEHGVCAHAFASRVFRQGLSVEEALKVCKEKNPTHKWCIDCKQKLPLSDFQKDGVSPKGVQRYRSACRECAAVRLGMRKVPKGTLGS